MAALVRLKREEEATVKRETEAGMEKR